MAGTGTGAKKYVVKLCAEERERLEAIIKSGKRSAQLITKARILLKADTSDAGEGWTDGEIAAALDTSVNTVGSARRQLVEEGFEATLVRKYNPVSYTHLDVYKRQASIRGLGTGTASTGPASSVR